MRKHAHTAMILFLYLSANAQVVTVRDNSKSSIIKTISHPVHLEKFSFNRFSCQYFNNPEMKKSFGIACSEVGSSTYIASGFCDKEGVNQVSVLLEIVSVKKSYAVSVVCK